MKFKIKIKDKDYEIEIKEEQDRVKIIVNGKEFVFEEKETSLPQVLLQKKNFSKKEILAPLDGVISKILVKEGDVVKKNQTLLFLSAMKMENEICAEDDGKIKKILVKEGDKVKKDDVLILLI